MLRTSWGCLLAGVAFLHLFASAIAEEEPKYDLHELSLWGLDPTLQQANELAHYPSAMPGVVDTDRSRANESRKLTPFSIITLHGEPVKDLEVDLRVQSGRFVGHWPPAESKSGRLRWLELASAVEADRQLLFATVDDKHWFNQARQLDALYLQDKSRAERFLTYDCELKYELPVQLTGGPDKYLITNSSKHSLLDVFVIVPQDDGVRVGRLESLPPSKARAPDAVKANPPAANPPVAPQAAPPDETAPKAPAEPQQKRAETKPAEADKPEKADTPDKREADAKTAEANAEAAKRAAAAQAQAAPAGAAAPAAPVPVQPVAAIPTGAAPGGAAPAVAPAASLEPTELSMSAVLPRDADELKAVSETITANLLKLGFTRQEVDLLVDRVGTTWSDTKEMVVVFRLPVEAIEERLPLVAYPAPRKTVRAALVAVRNIDPKIKDEVQKLIAQLGSPEYTAREDAEKRLSELGRLAIPALKTALKSNDLEIVFRSERILLSQNEKLEGT